ncbi:hypothetical protein Angca_004338 [Angiostrongylus cantonensis]|nr:hypothetical protein Angca_004338 [Angiostrongylus cantonensis]
MSSVQFRRCRGPKLLLTFSIRSIFIQCMVCPVAALALSFLLGSATHPNDFYTYRWSCGMVHLPSISRVINMPLERTIFQMLILCSVPLRLIILFRHWLRFSVVNESTRIFTVTRQLLIFCGGNEVLLLSLLSVIGERENGSAHVAFFSLFVAFSYFYFCALHLLTRWTYKGSESVRTAIKLQLIFFSVMTFSVPVTFLFFILYNVYCVTGGHELFAVFEYITVGALYGFHASSLGEMAGFIHFYHTNIKLHSIRV